jgi:hypothetical protein
MYNSSPQAGLAALTASPYADSDVMNVQMTPREVAGLQQLAMSYGANEQDLYDPVTGQPRFSFLKKILPMIAGAVLPGVPILGDIAKTIGFGNQALGSALLVGGVTGLVEGDLKKGLMAGLGAYSGAKIGEGFTAAGRADQVSAAPPPTPSLKDTAFNISTSPIDQAASGMPLSSLREGPISSVTGKTIGMPVQTVTQAPALPLPDVSQAAPPSGFFGTMGRGVQNVFASGAAGDASRKAFGDVFSNPLVRSATLMGGLAALSPEQEELSVPGADEDTFYVHGGFNPLYGTGAGQPMFLPGKHYKRTKKGVFEYNPYGPIRGAATGGLMQAPDQNLNQQRAFPHQYVPLPNPNQNYPLSTVTHSNYQSNTPQPREILSGYGPKIDPYTGEERFAEGGEVDDKEKTQPDRNDPGATANPFAAGAAGIVPGATKAGDAVQNVTGTTQQTPPSLVEANRKYVEELNRRAKNPTFTPYGSIVGGGFGGIYTGGNPYGPPVDTGGGGQGQTGGGAGDVAAFLATQVGINWLMQPGNAAALQKWITGGMKWADRPFLNADKAGTGTGTGTGTNTGTGQTGQTGGQQTQTGGETGGQQTQTGGETGGQQPTGAEKPPVFDPVKGIVIAGGTSAAAIAAAKALAASKGVITVTLLDGTVVAGGAGAAGAATGAAGAATGTGAATTGGATAAGGAGAGGGGAAAGGAGTQTGIASTLKGGATAAGTAAAAAAALIGAHQAYQGISKGKEGQAAAGGALAGAGGAYLAGASGLGGAGLTSLAGFGPVGLAAAAIAAIGASLVNTKEYGDVALRNYWNAVDAGRGIGQTDPNELAQGFINFYRTNKNEFAGQAKYGRTGNEDFVYDMTQVINNAVKDGKVNKDVDAATMYKEVVQPWLNSMGEGPKDEKARAIQDFMMTDLINSFMQGKPISNAQVKGDKKYKIVSEKPVYAGAPTTQQQTPVGQDETVRRAIEAYGMRGGIPAGINPYADTGREYIPRGGEEQFLAEGGAIGDDYNFGFAGGGMPEYQAGGTLLNGPGDGMSDSIPAVIRGKGTQRAALADGEFVVPADVVSHLGNGSTNAGAKKLYGMMDKIRQARTGRTRQAPAVKTDRYLPA